MKSKQDKESRLNQIEKGLASLLQGTAELRESQKKTDAQIRKNEKLLEKTIIKLDEILKTVR